MAGCSVLCGPRPVRREQAPLIAVVRPLLLEVVVSAVDRLVVVGTGQTLACARRSTRTCPSPRSLDVVVPGVEAPVIDRLAMLVARDVDRRVGRIPVGALTRVTPGIRRIRLVRIYEVRVVVRGTRSTACTRSPSPLRVETAADALRCEEEELVCGVLRPALRSGDRVDLRDDLRVRDDRSLARV